MLVPTTTQLAKIQANMSTVGFNLVYEVLQDYPAASTGYILCTSTGFKMDDIVASDEANDNPNANYSLHFEVWPEADDGRKALHYDVTVVDVTMKGFSLMFLAIMAGEHKAYFPNGLADFLVADNWDIEATDFLMQYHFYGEVHCG